MSLSNGDTFIFAVAETEDEIYVVLIIWHLMSNRNSSDGVCSGLEDKSNYRGNVFEFKRATQQVESDTFGDIGAE